SWFLPLGILWIGFVSRPLFTIRETTIAANRATQRCNIGLSWRPPDGTRSERHSPEARMPHPLFGPEVRYMLQENDTADMSTFCETLHPATVAEALADEFDVEETWRVLQNTSIKNQAAIFEYFPIDTQVRMVAGTGAPHMARLIEKMSHDDRADLLRRLQPQV